MTITDEMLLEACARLALCGMKPDLMERLMHGGDGMRQDSLRMALEAVAPLIRVAALDEAAKMLDARADRRVSNAIDRPEPSMRAAGIHAANGIAEAAEAIRYLKWTLK